MQLTHIALWTNHLERLRDFYVKYFNRLFREWPRFGDHATTRYY